MLHGLGVVHRRLGLHGAIGAGHVFEDARTASAEIVPRLSLPASAGFR